MKKKHNLNEEYLKSLSEEELTQEMSEWSAEEQAEYLCPNGVMTIEEFRELGLKIINDEYDRLGW
jgi:hypothetical protein